MVIVSCEDLKVLISGFGMFRLFCMLVDGGKLISGTMFMHPYFSASICLTGVVLFAFFESITLVIVNETGSMFVRHFVFYSEEC